MTWLLYGAYGYTGRLIAREAAARERAPILAGRDEAKLRALADELGLEGRAFALDDQDVIVKNLDGCNAVLHCAGPFSQTAQPMMEACLAAGVHYLDITGEIDVIEAAAALDGRAKEAGVVLLPAVGFDVVPTDCLAALLAQRLPTATHLRLAFSAGLHVSPGTGKTIVEGLPQGGKVRQDGLIVPVPLAWKCAVIPFADKPRWAMTIPWGDVASAYHSTGIGNIEVYLAARRWKTKLIRAFRWLAPLSGWGFVQSMWKKYIALTEKGPTDDQLTSQQCIIWGEASDEAGDSIQATMTTPNGYALTVQTALVAVEAVCGSAIHSGRARLPPSRSPVAQQELRPPDSELAPPEPGFHTPSTAFGGEFILQFDGVTLHDELEHEVHRPQRSAG